MSRTLYVAVAALAAALVIAAVAPAAPAPKTVRGTVGPGFTIDLTLGGKKVTTLKKGTYRFVCDPHSDSMHGSFRVA